MRTAESGWHLEWRQPPNVQPAPPPLADSRRRPLADLVDSAGHHFAFMGLRTSAGAVEGGWHLSSVQGARKRDRFSSSSFMSRRLRYLPRPMVVEVTCRTVHGRFLLHPSSRLNRVAIGILARAQKMYDVRVHAFCIMSNHYHLLVSATDALQLARFMNFVQSNLAREAGRLARWRERFWSRRYQAILVSDERDAQLSRLRYILSQGCKERIVARPEQWRGAQCVRELLSGKRTMEGIWIDRTAIHRNGGYRRSIDESQFITIETLALSPMPCFVGVDEALQCRWIRECIDAIVDEARRNRRLSDRVRPTSNTSTVRRDSAVVQPMKRAPAPWVHAASKLGALDLRVAYTLFLVTYRAAAETLKRGHDAVFPGGCFPPAKPYVPVVTR